MSLFKQISILLSIVFALLLMVITSISFKQIKDSAKISLYENVQNSVSNISLSITNANADESTIKTVINASFDNGNYEKIVFKDLNEKIVYKRTKEEENIKSNIPLWFLNLVSIKEVSSSSTVSKGWSVLGTIEVFAHRETFYAQMYNIFLSLSVTLITTFIIVLFLLSWIFKSILKPLDTIRKQSDAAMENKFIFQEKIPFTSEFKSLTISINSMVKKTQDMFNHANEILKKNKELLYLDELTKLYNRKYLVLKTSEYLEENSLNNKGFIISIILTRVDLLNKKLGYKEVDKLFLNMTKIMRNLSLTNETNFISRTNAAEFIIVLPRTNEIEVKSIAQELFDTLWKLLNNTINHDEIKLYLGVCTFGKEQNHSELLSKIDYTLCQSKASLNSEYYYLENEKIDQSKKNFKAIIENAIKNNYFNILYRDVISLSQKTKVYQTVSFEIRKENKVYSYADFIAPAVELNLLNDIYLNIIEKILKQNSFEKKVAIQIPNEFVQNLPFKELEKILKANKKTKNIIFEIEEESFVKHNLNCLAFISKIQEYDFDMAIFNFLGISDDYEYLKNKKPEYIKINQSFLEANENFDALNMLKTSLGLKLIATSVNSEDDLKTIKDKDIDLLAGKITQIVQTS